MNRAQRNFNIILLFLFSAYAIYSVVYGKSSLFFIIYLFWFDEVIRNISLLIQVKMHQPDALTHESFTKAQAISNIKTRFFFLFIYSVFIVIVFGIFFSLTKADSDILITNLKILAFNDLAFNICLMIAIIREAFQIRTVYLNRSLPILPFNAMSGHLITLHVSIIFGAFLWAITSGKFKGFSFSLGSLDQYAIILPFFIIKFLVDLYQINSAEKNKKSLLDSLK